MFSRGPEPTLPEKFFDSARKNCYANSQNTLSVSPHPVIISKTIPDFGYFISLDRIKSVFLFNKYKKNIFFIFWLLAFAREI